jgi:hypothetical protein
MALCVTHHHPITLFTLSFLCTTQSCCFLCSSPLPSFLLDTSPIQLFPVEPPRSSQLSHPAQDGRGDEGSCCCFAGLGAGTAPQEHNRCCPLWNCIPIFYFCLVMQLIISWEPGSNAERLHAAYENLCCTLHIGPVCSSCNRISLIFRETRELICMKKQHNPKCVNELYPWLVKQEINYV